MKINKDKFTIMLIPGGSSQTKQFSIPTLLIKLVSISILFVATMSGFFVLDYLDLRTMRGMHNELIAENQHLKGEAHILVTNLEDVKRSLRRIQDYTKKLNEIITLKVSKVSRKTGIGPLSAEEYSIQKNNPSIKSEPVNKSNIPLGINIDNLIFRPVIDELADIEELSNDQAVELQQLLSTLSEKKSLLSSIPSISPVQGWITSGFGFRVSPFTGQKSFHKALDIASPVGTPIIAPADGVVIFAGAKAGFGNFIMVAHYGYGIVTRYGHNAQNMVQAGQKIKRGEQIATVGMTGRTTGPHLHYEIWVNGEAVNPKKFILDTSVDFF
ncbi:MAG: M23 family metallopeptidase [Oligoflexales bacterium]|nr:M23 family metallopeptidase [Oligoflexales bacterium]